MNSILRAAGLGLLVFSLAAPRALADADGARKAIEQAKRNIEQGSYDRAETDLKLAEAELDGVSGADKDAVTKSITETRASIATTQKKIVHDDAVKKFDYLISEAKKSVGSASDFAIIQKDFDAAMAGEPGKSLSAEERAAYDKQFAPVKKVATAAGAEAAFKAAETGIAKLEGDAAAILPAIGKPDPNGDMAGKIRDYDILVTDVAERMKQLPDGDAKSKALINRYKKVSDAYTAATGAGEASAFAATIGRDWDRQAEEMNGWEKETTGPTMSGYLKENKGLRDAAPKTTAVVQNAGQWLKEVQRQTNYEAVKSAAPVKSLVDAVTKQRDAAREKMAKFTAAMLDEAEKMELKGIDPFNVGDSFPKNEMRFALGDDAPQLPKLQERAKAIGDKAAGVATAGQKAVEDLKKKLTEQADAAWPKIVASLGGEELSDATGLSGQKGKIVRIKRANRMGWDFVDEYAYAVAINGVPVAGKFAPHVLAAYTEVSAKVGGEQEIGEAWEVVGEVVGPGKVNAKLTADVRGQSGTNLGTVEGKEIRDCTVIKIIALKSGPLCVGPDGMVNEAGASVIPAGAAAGAFTGAGASRGGGGWGGRLLVLLVGMSAAAACLLKANYAPLAAIPQAGQIQTRVGGQNLAYIGLACAVIGLLFLLRGMFIYGLLVNASIIAAGTHAALDVLAARGIVKPDLLEKVRPLGVPIGLACAAAVIVHLLLGMMSMNLVAI